MSLMKLAWVIRPLIFGIAAAKSAYEGPPLVGVFGSVVLLGILALTYVPVMSRRAQASVHQ